MNLLQNPNKRRWYIVATIFVAIICNYLDRQLLSILKPEILTHFGIEDLQYAWIVNVFLSVTPSCIPYRAFWWTASGRRR